MTSAYPYGKHPLLMFARLGCISRTKPPSSQRGSHNHESTLVHYETPLHPIRHMKRHARVSLVLAFLAASIAGAADTVRTAEDLKGGAAAVADSNEVERARPQLSANTNMGPEVPMARETNRPAAPSTAPGEAATPAATQPRSPVWIILAVLAVFAARFLLKRLISRSRPS